MSTISPKKRKFRIDSKFWARVIVLLLVASMLAGTFYYILYFASNGHIHAAEADDGNITIRVAIFYDDTLTPDVVLTSENGFDLGYTNASRDFTYITSTDLTAVNVARHTNLKYNGSRYVAASSSSDTTVGSYHIRVASTEAEYIEDARILREAFPKYNVFTACFDEQFYVMIGQFATTSAAKSALSEIIKLISPTIIIPTPPPQTETTTPPETSEPETSESDTSEPDTSEPDTTEPDTSEPEISEPETSESDTSNDDSSSEDSSSVDSTSSSDDITTDEIEDTVSTEIVDSTDPVDSTVDQSTEEIVTTEEPTESNVDSEPDTSESDTIVTDTTVEDNTIDDTTVEDTTVEDTTVEDTTVEDTTVEDTTVEDTTVEDTTVEDTTVEETTEPEPIIIPPEVSLPENLQSDVENAVVHTPDPCGIVLIDPATHNIVWSFNRADGTKLFAIGPSVKNGNTCYMTALHGTKVRYYDGYFECAGYSPTGYYGVRVVNLVKLESYVVGVASAEIPTWWPVETIKAFIIAARSFAVKTLYGHGGSYNADVCNTSCCQVFNGYGPTVDRVWRAGEETRGILALPSGTWNSASVSGNYKMVYIGNVCGTYYSSSTGGCTANCTDVWGSSLDTYPYLKAVATPWEKYTTYSRGQKITTVTATALYQKLKSQGYTALKGDVTKVEITKTGKDTSYVTQIKFYDAKGNVVTVDRADKIKKLLSAYIDSSNFVVTKSGTSVTRTNYTMLGFGGVNDEETIGVGVLGNPFGYNVTGRGVFDVITATGLKQFNDTISEKVMTATGLKDLNMSYSLDSQYYPTISGINGEVIPDIKNIDTIVAYETLTTDYASNSFTFISRGWGHGVGLSQYGIYELGNLGYDYEYILESYYSGIVMKRMGSVIKGSDNRYYINFVKD